ncbi:lipoate--protein ligase family protein [Spirochaeta cellobiosiphila]|uniref:lipoate--protein ligase family protein n=1 Tax=Spirochaeta cellobiosiphila TaxID=504483 RepID=UPI0003F8A4B0|nr:lipoate--protein ligase family protein [Spirochaeta cellobiosiphila]
MNKQEWQIIEHNPSLGQFNMDFDQQMIDEYSIDHIPRFRLYGWSPPTISVGRFQNVEQDFPVSVVRRMTGGGAIYHHNELTYSLVCAPSDLGNPKTVKKAYESITGFIIRFYSLLGLNAYYAKDEQVQNFELGAKTWTCFEGREEYDILIQGRKIGGNAQKRSRDLIFQHGSIPLGFDWKGWEEAFRAIHLPSEETIVALNDLIPVPERFELYSLMKQAFAEQIKSLF